MRNPVVTIILFVCLMTAPPAIAGDHGVDGAGGAKGWYFGLGFGISEPSKTRFKRPGLDMTADWKGNPAGGIFGGRDFGGFRGEFEVMSRSYGLGALTVAGDGGLAAAVGAPPLTGTLAQVKGRATAQSYLINFYKDFGPTVLGTPYVGVGAGLARIGFRANSGAVAIVTDHDTRLGYQAIAGLKLWQRDRMALSMDYRYFATARADVTDRLGQGIRGRMRTHNVMASLTWHFGAAAAPVSPLPPSAPPPAPTPAPPPPPAATAPPAPSPAPPPPPEPTIVEPVAPGPFLVFFDWDQATIRPDAAGIIEQAARAARDTGWAVIEAIGHADRSGPEPYNLGLSLRRAEAVREALAGHGIDPATVTVRGLGETVPLLATPDGLREPQNRRVEIVFPDPE